MRRFVAVDYWNERYRSGKGSGQGSLGPAGLWKAKHVNELVVGSVLDLGCGDGQQAALFSFDDYLGVDASREALKLAAGNCPTREFRLLEGVVEPRDTHLSLDVIYHLVNDKDYNAYMSMLFAAKQRVIVYSSDFNQYGAKHVRHRRFSDDIPKGWQEAEHTFGPWSYADLFVYDRT